MRTPCDEADIRSRNEAVPRRAAAQPWILAATILGSSMVFIDGTVVNVALPVLQTTFHATVVDVQWVVESYGLFLSSLILAGGALGDLFGRRRVFLIGVGIFAVASAACSLASSVLQLIIARSVQGVGAALLVPGSLAIIGVSFDEKSRGKALGTWSGFTAITTEAAARRYIMLTGQARCGQRPASVGSSPGSWHLQSLVGATLWCWAA